MNATSELQKYHNHTRGYLYSYIACIPLLVLYEFLIRITQPDTTSMVRISVDIWIQQLFRFAGLNALSALFFVALVIGGIILYNNRKNLHDIQRSYFWGMAIESLVYAIFIGFVIQASLNFVFMMDASDPLTSLNRWQLFALSLGAGLYEELFFRVILVSVLLYLFKSFVRNKSYVQALAIVTAAFIFSASHYIGNMGDMFTLHSFLFRFLFGLALNFIYIKRGFGIAAWTHALYDVIVVLTSY